MTILDPTQNQTLSPAAQVAADYIQKAAEALKEFTLSTVGQVTLRETLPLLTEAFAFITEAIEGDLSEPGIAAKLHFHFETLQKAFALAAEGVRLESSSFLKGRGLDVESLRAKVAEKAEAEKTPSVGQYL